ncbi:uncharacterized protein LOC115787426 [Archocentrus centrarchus]|uniref:uncharacterized protein LOC115787426 n=1 Tax=Archocentrus centrarchus TaxID=63155 RepID=UPI0011E9E5D2|nr:uncharacterized protein LOC115787426 [Archocentrus centrarchus]
MQRYLWPGYELQLLGGLQRQQTSAQFCDTLLQTEGISVPTHSCILAALSPYLSQKLSASPSPPCGQKRLLQLQAVKAQTLLKLVGLLYSGVLEVKGNKEKSEVLAAAHQFGITDLVQEWRDGVRESPGNCRERQGILKIQDADVEAEMAGKGEKNSAVRKKSCVSVGTQTITITETSVDSSAFLSSQTKPANPEPASSAAQGLDVFIALPYQNITPCPTISSDGESTFSRSSDSVTNPTSTSALPTDTATFPAFRNDSSSSETQEDCNQDSSESGDNIQWWAKERAVLEDGKTNSSTSENESNPEESRRLCRDEITRKEDSTEKNHSRGNAGVKDITKMKEMQTTQISIKVKLRRRTTGESWEVVNIQSPDEMLSVVTSLTQDCIYNKPQTDEVQPPPSPAHPCPVLNPEVQNLPPAVPNTSKQPEHHHSTTSDTQSFSSSSFTSNHNSAPESVPLPQPQGAADESDELIEKLLEDIMMGLNILPNLESDCNKSEASHGGAPTVCRLPVTASDAGQTQMDAAECVFYQDLGTQNDHTSADTGIHCCLAVPDQPGCTPFPAAQPDGLIQQQEPRSPRYYSPVRSLGQIDGLSCQGPPLSKSQDSLYPKALLSSVPSSDLFSGVQKLSYAAIQSPSSQDDQHSLKVLPLSNGNGTQPEPALSLPCMDDLRLPRCLSPLEPRFATKNRPLLNNSANPDHDAQLQPSLHWRPWFSENPGSLQFPFSSITFTDDKSKPLPPDPHRSCELKERQEEKDSNPKNGGTRAEGCTANSLKGGGKKSAAELKLYSRRMKECFRYKHDDATGSRRKRRRTNRRQDAAGSCSAHRNVKAGDGTKSCSVSLSSNNVLVKEREMAMMSSNMRRVRKAREMSTINKSEEEQPKESSGTKRTRIRTRGFVKNSQEAATNTTPSEKSPIFKPAVFSAPLVNQPGVPVQKRKRGRPRKIKLLGESSESVPAIVENKGDNVNHEQVDWDLPKEEEEEADKKTEKRCRKRRRNTSSLELDAIPVKKIESAECTGKAKEATNNDIKPGPPKQRHTVTLKEFQKLINRQHSKRMKLNEETHRDAERKARANADGRVEKKVGPEERTNTEQHHEGSDIAVDQNHNLFATSAAQCCKSQQEETSGAVSEKGSLDGDGDHPVSLDVKDEAAAKVTTEGEQPLTNPDEGMTGDLDTAESPIKDEGSSQSDALLPRAETTLDCTLLPRTLETISRTSGCDQKGEEEEDEEEVDVLVYSPEKAPLTTGCGAGLLNSTDVTPDEDEEEDVNEIDVTGDEAE